MKALAKLCFLIAVLGGCSQTVQNTRLPVELIQNPKLEVLSTGADFSGSNGIIFGPDGYLYVTSVTGTDLSVLDTETGKIVKRFGPEEGVVTPDDVAFSPDGSVYWTSILTGEVAGFDTNGEKVVAAQLSLGPNPITFSDDGRLFVAQCFLGHNLYELDPKGVEDPRLIADDLGDHCGLNGMDWGPDGRLYGPKWFQGRVLSLDVDTGERRVEAEGFKVPASIKFDSKGVLHVLDTGAGELIRINKGEKTVIASMQPGLDNFAFDADDTPFVSSFADGFIKRVNDDGTTTDITPGGLSHPSGITVIGDTVWVGDIQALRGFNRITGEEISVTRNVLGVSEVGGSFGVSKDGENLILTSWFDNDVRVWDPVNKKRLQEIKGLAKPITAVRYAGGIAIAEHGTNSVKLYREGEPTLLAADLSAPTGLVVDGEDLLMSDRNEGKIKRIARNGVALEEPEILVEGLNEPEGFLTAHNGFVVVEDTDVINIVFINAQGERNTLASFAPGSTALPGYPPSFLFNGIAMDEDGNLIIPSETERLLYRMKAPW